MKIAHVFLVIFLVVVSQTIYAQSKSKPFNGKNLKGWYAFEPKSGVHVNAEELFTVENKMIRLHGKKVGYLMSEGSYQNFELTAEFRWNTDSTFIRKSTKLNSGLMYLVPNTALDTLWPKGIQFQIKQGATGDFILLQEVTVEIENKQTEPGRSVVVQRKIDASKPIGEWNTIVVLVSDGEIKQKLNGVLVNSATNPSVNAGRILLQYEGFPIDFRKIKIRKL